MMINCDKDVKVEAKNIMKKYGQKFTDINTDGLKELYDFFQKK